MSEPNDMPAGKTGSRLTEARAGSAASPSTVLRLARRGFVALAVIALTVAAGFAYFANYVSTMRPAAEIPQSDAIVVLTGGRNRLETGLELLRSGKARRMLISGVHEHTRKSDLRAATGGTDELFECCIDIDRTALDTVGNATESAKWLAENGFRNVLLVTSSYHMPRSLLEARRAYSGIDVRPYPVTTGENANGNWMSDRATFRILATEYIKYLAALSGASPRYKAARAQ